MREVSGVSSVYFIDSSVEDYEKIIKELPKDSPYVLLDSTRDGIRQCLNYQLMSAA